MANDNQPYGIGSDVWPGLAKLMEEMGELQQVLGKVMACEGPSAIYWDMSSLVPQIIEEAGDVSAAMGFFLEQNLPLSDRQAVNRRGIDKLEKFNYWHKVHQQAREGHRA